MLYTQKKRFSRFRIGLIMMVMMNLLGVILSPMAQAMEDNSASVPGNPSYTDDAFYYSDQYMWKVSLFVAKSDTVYRDDTADMDDFYRIGNDAVYISPVASWNDWVGKKRPQSPITQIYYSADNKVDTLATLKTNGNDVSQLPNVSLVGNGGINMIVDANAPKVPQLSDGDVLDNGVIVKNPNMVGNVDLVQSYFNDDDLAYGILNYFAGTNGKSAEDYLKTFNFTINGETRNNWNPEGLIPREVTGVNDLGKPMSNTTSQLQWLIVYEPVSIVYVKDAGAGHEAYYGYALTATDFAVMQIKHQMDWRYNELKWPAWTGNQPDAWKNNSERQHVSALAFLLMGNSMITEKTWFGLEASTGYVDKNAAIPNNRWTSDAQIKYGGWGMSRLTKPVTLKENPPNQDYRSDTDIIYACDLYSNKQAGDEGDADRVTVTYEINGETFTDQVSVPIKTAAKSYFKWHAPAVTTTTAYNLKITVSPYPYATLGVGGYEYTNQTITVRPLTEVTPPDPKVADTVPADFTKGLIPPVPNAHEQDPSTIAAASIQSVTLKTEAPHYLNEKVAYDVVTNGDTTELTLSNQNTMGSKQLTESTIGQGILQKMTRNTANNTITWEVAFIPIGLGVNNYALTPSNSAFGAGESYNCVVNVEGDPDIPIIKQIVMSPLNVLNNLFTEIIALPLEYQVAYNTVGGTIMDSEMIKSGELLQVPSPPQKEGYSFAGWFKDQSYEDPWNFDEDHVESAVVLYAQWSIELYTAEFDTLGGNAISPVSATYGSNIAAPAIPLRTGYTFMGWNKDIAGEQQWNFEIDTVTSNTIIYAEWEKKNFNVTYDTLGGSPIDVKLAEYDAVIIAPNPPTRVGYIFSGWFKNSTCTTVWTWASDRIMGDTTLYAKWISEIFTISFETEEGTTVPNQSIQGGMLITSPIPSVRDGYTLEGWYSNDTYTSEERWDFATDTPSKDMTLYAKWMANEAQIEFATNGGTVAESVMMGWAGKEIVPRTMPLAERDGYTFAGWYKESNFSGAAITELPAVFPIGITHYFAKWTINQYVVSFQENGGSDVSNQVLNYGSLINEAITVTSQNGYTFAGWYKDSGLTQLVNFTSDAVPGAMTLYAKWLAKDYMINFVVNGGSPVDSISQKFDTLISEPSINRYGFTLIGWYTEATYVNKWNFSSNAISGAMTLYANWNEDKYRLIDLFPDIALAEIVRLEINVHADRLGNPVLSVYDKVVTQKDIDLVTSVIGENGTVISLEGISKLKNITIIDLSGNAVKVIPEEIGQLTKVITMDLSENELITVSDGLWELIKLETLNLSQNQIDQIDNGISALDHLTHLDVSHNNIDTLPTALFDAFCLENLNLSSNPLNSISTDIGSLKKLIILNISDDKLTDMPYSIGSLPALTELYASDNELNSIPLLFKDLDVLKILDLSKNNYQALPPTIVANWVALENFNLADNQLNALTPTIGSLLNLQDLNASSNQLSSIPKELTALAKLLHLNLSDNSALKYLPLTMGNLSALNNLWINNTTIDQLPLSMENKPVVIEPSGLPYGYAVQFDKNGGDTTIPTIRQDYSLTINEPSQVPVKNGYTFMGWHKDAQGSQSWIFETDQVLKTTTLYATWEANPAKIIFNVNNGTSVDGQDGFTDQNIANRTMPVTTRDGYTFKGWFLQSDFTGSAVTQLPSAFPPNVTTYHAKWQADPSVISFMENSGGAIADLNGTTDQIISNRTMPTVVRSGYTFKGWFTDPDLSGNEITQLPDKYPIGGISYYAKWEVNPSAILFEENNGTPLATDLYGYTDGPISDRTPPSISRTGYYWFRGWFDNAAFTGSQITQLPATFPANGQIYYAKWERMNYAVTFDANGGTGGSTLQVNHGDAPTTPAIPTRSGYNFLNWYTTSACTTLWNQSTPITAATTFYAKWELATCTVTYDATGGSVSPATKTVNYNTSIGTLPTPSRLGHVFNGWYTAATGGTSVSASTLVTSTSTIYAHWTINTFTVTFNANGGSGGTSQSVNYNASPYYPTSPYRSGYSFTGWYTTSGCTTAWTQSTPITAAKTYYAGWSIDYYPVYFNGNGGSVSPSSRSVAYGSSIGSLPVPTRSGYTFTGWFNSTSGGSQVYSSTTVYGYTYIYAQWASSHTVTFNANGGSVSPGSTTVSHNASVGSLPTPTRSGYTFTNWYTASSGGSVVSSSTTIGSDTTFYAQWTLVEYLNLTSVMGNRCDSWFLAHDANTQCGYVHPPLNTTVSHVYVKYGTQTFYDYSPDYIDSPPNGGQTWRQQYWYVDVVNAVKGSTRTRAYMNGGSYAHLCNQTNPSN